MLNNKIAIITLTFFIVFVAINNHKPVTTSFLTASQLDGQWTTKMITPRGKPNAGVDVIYRFPDNIIPGQTFEIQFTLTSQSASGELQVDVHPENIEVLNPSIKKIFNLNTGPEHKFTLTIYAPVSGQAFLNLFISESDSNSHSRQQVHSIPVQVGTSTNQLNANIHLTQDSENNILHSMPVQETVIQDITR